MAEAEPELEAMKMDDCSWHPCQVYFSPNGASLVIQYGNDNSQDILVSEKEALMRIRVRSLPLQDDDCTKIKPGEHVIVVNQNSESETGFFDAEVEKVLRVRHSKKMNCRCSFMIRWLHKDLNSGSLTVPSTSVMRLANRSIDKHPTISAFIDANSTFAGMSPELNVVNDFDLDLQNLLEKQIEGIKNSVHHSKKRIRDEIKGLEANALEQEKDSDISLPNVTEPEIKFSTRSPLNPLAARAALASVMSKLPQSLEISTGIDDISTIMKLPLKTEPAPKAVRNVKKSLFSTDNLSEMSQVVEVSSVGVVNQSGKGHAKAEKMNSEIKTVLTRAKGQKAKGVPYEKFERSDCVDSKKPITVTNRRFTRSVLHQDAASIKTETKKESDGEELPSEQRNKKRNTESTSLFSTNSSEMSQVVEVSAVVVNQSGKGHAKANKMIPEITTGLTHANSQNFEGVPDEKFKRSNCADSKKPSTVTNRRFTRSVLHQEAASFKTETKKESGGEELPTEQWNKKRNTEGTVTSNGGSSNGNKKNFLDLTNHKVLRSSPRFNSKC